MDRDQLVRIRLLSTRFHQLQGLRLALGGMVYAIVFGSYLLALEPTEAGVLVALGVSTLVMLPGDRALRRYYHASFGRQVPYARDPRRLLFVYAGMGFFGALLKLDPPSLCIGIVGAYSLWVAIRDWPLRRYYVGAAAAVAVAVAAQFTGRADPDVTLAMSFLAIGVAYVPIGFLDHRLLVTLVRESREAAVAAAEVHSPNA
jgi:hypothetical protein